MYHHPRAVHAKGSDPQVRRIQDQAVVLHVAHLLFRRGAHRQPRQGAGDVHQPDADAIDKGLRPTNHTDFVVAPLDQMFMLWSAVNRISRGGEVIGLEQRVTPIEGLKAMTIKAADQYGEQDRRARSKPASWLTSSSSTRIRSKVDADGDQGHQGRGDDQGRETIYARSEM